MPVPTRDLISSSDGDTYSLMSQATTTMTIGDSLPAQLVRKSARKGFTFNIMSVGQPNLGKTTILSALFGKNLEVYKEKNSSMTIKDPENIPILIDSKAFEIDEKKVRLKLTVVECKHYGEALSLTNSHKPLVEFIDLQFADYHKRESGVDRRSIQDKMIHCLFFFISPFVGRGLSDLDLEFLRAVHGRVNVVPIIAKSEALTAPELGALKRRIKEQLEKNKIQVYRMPDPDIDDTDDMKRGIKEIQDAMPFAVCSMELKADYNPAERCLDWITLDPYDRDQSDFLLLKTMLHTQMPDLRDSTHEVFYEDYRLRRLPNNFCSNVSGNSSRSASIKKGGY